MHICDSVEDERRALETIQIRNQRGRGGPSFSPLGNIDGSNPTLDSIEVLRDSPLCWPATLAREDAVRVDLVLNILACLYDRAVTLWDDFRMVFDSMPVLSSDDDGQYFCVPSLPIYERWPDGTFPADIQRRAKSCYWLLKSTSRISLSGDAPSEAALMSVCQPVGAVTFKHVAGLAAVVCIVRALERLERTLQEWAQVLHRYSPGAPFTWLCETDGARVGLILAQHVANIENEQGQPSDRDVEIDSLIEAADAWLELADVFVGHTKDIAQASERAEERTRAQISGQRTLAAKTAAKQTRGKARAITPADVAKYFNERPGQKYQTLQSELASEYKVSESTVARRYKDAKNEKLLS